MGLFVGKTCAGLAWAQDGQCWGVHLSRVRDRLRVDRFWHTDARSQDALSARLSLAAQALQVQENTVVVVGGAGCRCGFADVAMPRLNPEDLRSALNYELGKHAPVSGEKLVWGYRLLPARKGEQSRVRLIYLRESEWGKWLEDISGLGCGVDLILSPLVALDPLFADRDVGFCDGAADRLFVLASREGGTREILRGSNTQDGVFGALPAPLACPGLDCGDLARLPPEQQQGYGPALVLAMYGLTRNLETDARTCIPVPYELRPRRNLAGRLLAGAMALYVLIFLGIWLAREYRAASAHLAVVREQCRQVEGRIAEIEQLENTDEQMTSVAKDLGDALIQRPSLAACLLEITRLLQTSAWVSSFAWNGGKIELQIQTTEENLDVLPKLRAAPFFLDVVPIGTTVEHQTGKRVIRLQMRAGFNSDAGMPEAPTGADTPPPVPQGRTAQDHAPQDQATQDHAPEDRVPEDQAPEDQAPEGRPPQATPVPMPPAPPPPPAPAGAEPAPAPTPAAPTPAPATTEP